MRILTLLGAALASLSASSGATPVRLANGSLEAIVTPRFGGRGLHLSLEGRANLFRIGEAVASETEPRVDAFADNIPYFGHTVWLGPQSEWWAHQDIHPARREARAPWPPDPWLNQAPTAIVEESPRHLVLEGTASPLAGVRLRKGFVLGEGEAANTVHHWAEAENVSDAPVAWDLWFNTRVAPGGHVYVPVSDTVGLRFTAFGDPTRADLETRIEGGLLSLLHHPLPPDLVGRKGKVALQPAAGWMAYFDEGQVLLIEFPHEPAEAMHPEQGQVELYLDWEADDPTAGILELEVHAPYRTLAPGGSMRAAETWRVLPYDGPATSSAHHAFLRQTLSKSPSP
ncbi:MAG: DUF4380 domain-containing protein [Opitutales bacterium]